MSGPRQILTSMVAASVLWLGAAASVAAQKEPAKPVSGEVLVIEASDKAGTKDPELAKEPALQHRSFSSYRSMKLLARHSWKAIVGTPQEFSLPNGRSVKIALDEVLKDGRYQARLSINQPGKNDYLKSVRIVLAPGVPIFQAGQKHGAADLIIGIRLGKSRK